MTYQTLNIEIQGAIAHVRLNRPDAYNSMNKAFWNEFPEAITALDRTGETRVVVLSSTGKHFTAGMDTSVFTDPNSIPMNGEPSRDAENLRRIVLDLQECFNVLEKVRMPVLAAIQGGCIGGGVDMVSATDCRYCTEDAFFTIKETDLGMTADVGTLQRLPHLIPQGLIRELAYTGRKLFADEAKAVGLVNQVYKDQDTMLNAVMDIAQQIAERSPLAVAGCKEMINYTRDHTVADSLNYIATWQAGMFRQTDVMKAFAAKAQKTVADFDNLYPREKPMKD